MKLRLSPTLVPAFLVLLMAFGATRPAAAQISSGANTNVIGGVLILGNDIAYDPVSGVYLSVGSYGPIYGVFVSPAGNPVSAPFGIGSASSASFGHYPRVLYSPDLNGGSGGFLVTWHQADGLLHSIVVAYPTGVVSTEQVISTGLQGGTRAGGSTGLAYSRTSHNFLVTWTTFAFGIQGRFLDSSGTPSSAVVQYVSAGGAQEPQIAWNPATDEFGMAYSAFNSVSAYVGFIRVPASGAPPSAPTSFGFAGGSFSPSIAVHTTSNHFIVGWSIGGGSNSTEFDQNGVQVSPIRFLGTRVGTPTSFNLAFNPLSGTYLAVSEDNRSLEIAGIELDSDGSPLGAGVGISNGATNGSYVPRVASRTDAREWSASYSRNFSALANQIVSTATKGSISEPPCWATVSFTPAAGAIVGAAGVRSFVVNASDGCPWSTESLSPGLSIVQGAGPGTATVSYSVTANLTGAPRTLSIRIAGKTFSTTQAVIDQIGAVQFGGSADGDALLYNATTGDARLEVSTSSGFSAGSTIAEGAGWTILPADLNGDGLTDHFNYNATTGNWTRRLNNGDGTFRTASSGTWRAGWTITPGDFDGDERTDLFLYNPATGVWFEGLSTDNDAIPFDFGHNGVWASGWTVYPADFNGDGRTDLFLFNRNNATDPRSGQWYRVLTRADQTFDYEAGAVSWDPAFDVTPADYNGDGITDLFLYRPTGDFYRVRFTPAGPEYDGVHWRTGWTLRKADFNGDGRADLLLHNPSNGMWYEVINEANGSLSYYGAVWRVGLVPSVTDLDSDGRADVLLYDASDGTTYKAMTRTPGSFEYIEMPSFGAGWTAIATRVIIP